MTGCPCDALPCQMMMWMAVPLMAALVVVVVGMAVHILGMAWKEWRG